MTFLFIGWYLQLSHGGNISQINSYRYYIESLFSIMGVYIVALNMQDKIKWIDKLGRMSLYVIGFHSLLIGYALNFVDYILGMTAITNEFWRHMFIAMTTVVLSYVVSDLYVLIKKNWKEKYIGVRNFGSVD